MHKGFGKEHPGADMTHQHRREGYFHLIDAGQAAFAPPGLTHVLLSEVVTRTKTDNLEALGYFIPFLNM